MERVIAGSSCWLTVAFKDKDGDADTPDSATWETHDVESGEELQAATEITSLASSVEITIPPSVNALVRTNDEETRRVVIRATFGDDDACVARYDYEVVAT